MDNPVRPAISHSQQHEGTDRSLKPLVGLRFPTFFSLILPLAGTASFWEDIQNAALAPNLRLRDLDGETIAYSRLADLPNSVASFVEAFTRRPWLLVNRRRVLLSTLRRIWNARTFNLVQWYVIVASNLRAFIWSRGYPSPRRSYLAGEDVLDPQYSEHPKDITTEDWRRYFEPIEITDDRGGLAQWLQPYAPEQMQVRVQGGPNTEAEDLGAPKEFRGCLKNPISNKSAKLQHDFTKFVVSVNLACF